MRHIVKIFLPFVAFFIFSAPALARQSPDGFADLAEKLIPAVVNISTTQTLTQRDDFQEFEFQFPEGSPFGEFFRDFFEKQGKNLPGGKNFKRKATSLGSGFVIDPAGYIVTNYHVIQDADEITVIMHDDTNLKAKVVGRDKKTDLALLKVESKKPLQAVAFGNSDAIRVGDWVMAIGNPYGLGGTVTAGIISARARNINSGPYDDYLQTDASINRGNSGGPMFNLDGEVIGVNTAIFSPTGGSVGIGFAIPSSLAKNVIQQLKETGHTRRGWLGVRIQTVTKDIAKSLGMDEPRGALVSGITKEGPAEKSGLRMGDVILEFDGKEISDMHRLPRIVAETEVGKTVSLTVLRKNVKQSFKVKVGELDSDEEEELASLDDAPDGKIADGEKIEGLGLTVAPLTDGLRARFGASQEIQGLAVVALAPDGIASRNGIAVGDVISEAAQKDVSKPKDLADIAAAVKKEGRPLLLLVERSGELRFLALVFDQ